MLLSKSIMLHEQIEMCREKLHSLVHSKGFVNDPEVIEASQELDKLILSFQKMIFYKRM
jgi:hypothetical protein